MVGGEGAVQNHGRTEMNATATIRSFFAALLCGAAAIAPAQEARREANPDAKLHRFSTTVEKERPELDEETKRLVAAFRRDPSDANRAALRAKVAEGAKRRCAEFFSWDRVVANLVAVYERVLSGEGSAAAR